MIGIDEYIKLKSEIKAYSDEVYMSKEETNKKLVDLNTKLYKSELEIKQQLSSINAKMLWLGIPVVIAIMLAVGKYLFGHP